MISYILALFLSAEPSLKPYEKLDDDLIAWKSAISSKLANNYSGDQVDAFERWIIEPTCALMAASRSKIISPLHMRVYLREYFELMQVGLGECDERVVAQQNAHIAYTVIEPTLKQIGVARNTYPSVRRKFEYKHCEKIVSNLGEKFDVASLLPEHNA